MLQTFPTKFQISPTKVVEIRFAFLSSNYINTHIPQLFFVSNPFPFNKKIFKTNHLNMSLTFFSSLRGRITARWPVLLYAGTWTILLTATVAVASFAPEMAFVSGISASSSFSRGCQTEGAVRVPLDVPGEIICFPAHLFVRSKIDLIVPPVFAAVVVAGSAWVVRSMGFWEDHEER